MQHYLSDQNEKTFIDQRKPKIDLSGQKCNLTTTKKKVFICQFIRSCMESELETFFEFEFVSLKK